MGVIVMFPSPREPWWQRLVRLLRGEDAEAPSERRARVVALSARRDRRYAPPHRFDAEA